MAWPAGQSMMAVLSWVLTLGLVCLMGWLSYRYWSRMSRLEERLARGDASLLKESNVEIEEVIQAPAQSQLRNQQMMIAVDVDQTNGISPK